MNEIYEYAQDRSWKSLYGILHLALQDIQYGHAEDKYGWCTIVE